MKTRCLKLAATFALLLLAGCALPSSNDPVQRLAEAVQRRPVVLLGEVHDNEAQHAMRAEALRRVLQSGARPALAFEQFDRERQADLDRARSEPLAGGVDRIDHLIAQGKGAISWNWKLYRPYLELALRYDLPIVAANLSRADAMQVALRGFDAVFDRRLQQDAELDRLPAAFYEQHQRAIDAGHCGLSPPAALPGMARAQVARDLALALAIRPHIERGVILLAGNGHVRNDIGVAVFFTPEARLRTLTIGLLELNSADAEKNAQFDVTILTPPQPREDQCAALRQRFPAGAGVPAK